MHTTQSMTPMSYYLVLARPDTPSTLHVQADVMAVMTPSSHWARICRPRSKYKVCVIAKMIFCLTAASVGVMRISTHAR